MCKTVQWESNMETVELTTVTLLHLLITVMPFFQRMEDWITRGWETKGPLGQHDQVSICFVSMFFCKCNEYEIL